MLVVLVLFLSLQAQAVPLQEKYNELIVFPNVTNALPLPPTRISISKDEIPFAKAIKSIHYGAARLLDLANEETRMNWVVSPISLASMLGQLMLGAKGHFRQTIGEILTPGKNLSDVLPGLDVHKELGDLLRLLQDDIWKDYKLYIATAVFLQPDILLKLSYKHALADFYNVNIYRTDFAKSPESSNQKINDWVQNATFGKITEVVAETAGPTTASLFINTVYFRGTWKAPFDPTLTKTGFFSLNSTHKIPIDFMSGEMEVKYLEDETTKCRMIGIPYQGSSIYLYVFLPDKDSSGDVYNLHGLAADLTPDRMTELIRTAQLVNVTVTLPKVKLTTTLSLRKPMARAISRRRHSSHDLNSIRGKRDIPEDSDLLALYLSNSYAPGPLPLKIDFGSREKYSLTFNMGSASDDYRFKIDDILHKVQLEMTESGVEAVAVTTTLVDYFGNLLFRVDRPFIFLIRHEFTGVHLFWGAISNPMNLK